VEPELRPRQRFQAVVRPLASGCRVCAAVSFLTCLAFGADSDLVLQNGKIVTVDARFSIRQAVAIKNGRITAVGSNRAVPALERVFGEEGMRYFFPLRSYLDAGIVVAGGSDHMIGYDKNRAVNPYNPFMGLWTSVTRRTIRGTVIHPEERVTREEAPKMHAIWGAYRQFSEKKKGSIEPGKLADLVVIDRDYLTCPEDQIRDIQPVMVIVDGRIAQM